jgi:hypothetical protein
MHVHLDLSLPRSDGQPAAPAVSLGRRGLPDYIYGSRRSSASLGPQVV